MDHGIGLLQANPSESKRSRVPIRIRRRSDGIRLRVIST